MEKFEKEAKEKVRREQEDALKKAKGSATKNGSAKQAAPVVDDPDAWSQEQQKQMEAGMREFGANMPTKERWIAIAEKVEGKSAKECFTRFKELCAKAKAQQ
jgi:hypothetical protein